MFYGLIISLLVLLVLILYAFELDLQKRALYHFAGTLQIGQNLKFINLNGKKEEAFFLALAFRSGKQKEDWIVLTKDPEVVRAYREKKSVPLAKVNSLIHLPLKNLDVPK